MNTQTNTQANAKNGHVLVKGINLTNEQKSLLTFKGMSNPKFVKNHSFWFKDGKPSTDENFYYPISHSFSHLFH